MAREGDTRLQDVGEDALVAGIARMAGTSDPRVIVGIGDDAAVLKPPREGKALIVTVDCQVEDIHFRRRYATPHDIGWKSLAINLSDVAAMGGLPRHAVVSLVLPPDLQTHWLEELYRGITELAAAYGVTVVGGNLSGTTGPIMVDVTVLGEVEDHLLLRRGGAGEGDRLIATGTLGAAATALVMLERGLSPDREQLLNRHLRPRPRVHEGRLVAVSGLATAMIDLSDGLATDLLRLCDAGNLGVRIEGDAVPIDAATREAARVLTIDALEIAVAGGEDYEMLIAAPPARADSLVRRLREETGTAATVIGEFVDRSRGRVLVRDGQDTPLAPRGWDHFHP